MTEQNAHDDERDTADLATNDAADLAAGERVCRLHFPRPVASAEAIRAELVRAARGGRATARTG